MNVLAIPELEARCGSWVLTHRKTGQIIEIFASDRKRIVGLDADQWDIETAAKYLGRLNNTKATP